MIEILAGLPLTKGEPNQVKMNGEATIVDKKHSTSWLTSSPVDDKTEATSKPKWFEEMVKNTDSDEKKVEMLESKEKDEDFFELEREFSAKENRTTNSNQIYSKRRNTMNILKTENQNFLNTLSKSAKPFADDIFIAQVDRTSGVKENFKETILMSNDDRPSESMRSAVDPSFKLVDGLVEGDRLAENNRKSDSRMMVHSELPDEMVDSKRSKQSSSGLSEALIAQADRQLVSGLLDNQLDSIEEDFIIPHLPEGKMLRIVLKSNWGDENWIGMNGVELFDSRTFQSLTSANIKFLNNLETSPEKLIDQNYRTRDEDHIWKCRFDKNTKEIELKLEFDVVRQIALLRIWNYNKSRIYSYRGVKDLHLFLDDVKIFDGQIEKAHGELKGSLNKFGDTILYTVDESILEQISKNDTSFRELLAIT